MWRICRAAFCPLFLMNMQSVGGGGVDSDCLFATSLATLPEGQESRCMQLLLLPSNCSVCLSERVCLCVCACIRTIRIRLTHDVSFLFNAVRHTRRLLFTNLFGNKYRLSVIEYAVRDTCVRMYHVCMYVRCSSGLPHCHTRPATLLLLSSSSALHIKRQNCSQQPQRVSSEGSCCCEAHCLLYVLSFQHQPAPPPPTHQLFRHPSAHYLACTKAVNVYTLDLMLVVVCVCVCLFFLFFFLSLFMKFVWFARLLNVLSVNGCYGNASKLDGWSDAM